MKKNVLFLAVGALSLTLFSFKPSKGIQLMPNGNYYVQNAVLSETDAAKMLSIHNTAQGAAAFRGAKKGIIIGKINMLSQFSEFFVIGPDAIITPQAAPEVARIRKQVDAIMAKYLN